MGFRDFRFRIQDMPSHKILNSGGSNSFFLQTIKTFLELATQCVAAVRFNTVGTDIGRRNSGFKLLRTLRWDG